MNVVITNRTRTRLKIEPFLESLLRIILQVLKSKKKGTIELTLVGDHRMRALNKKFRGKDRTTDVLSFSYWQDPSALVAGELVISIPVAKKQAHELGHSLKAELAFLFVHGVLHVAGYDHETSKEKKVMLERTQDILLPFLKQKGVNTKVVQSWEK